MNRFSRSSVEEKISSSKGGSRKKLFWSLNNNKDNIYNKYLHQRCTDNDICQYSDKRCLIYNTCPILIADSIFLMSISNNQLHRLFSSKILLVLRSVVMSVAHIVKVFVVFLPWVTSCLHNYPTCSKLESSATIKYDQIIESFDLPFSTLQSCMWVHMWAIISYH